MVGTWPGEWGKDGWDTIHVWIVRPSPAALQILKIVAMWSGPTRHSKVGDLQDSFPRIDKGVWGHLFEETAEAYEMNREQFDWFQKLCNWTKVYRQPDLQEFELC